MYLVVAFLLLIFCEHITFNIGLKNDDGVHMAEKAITTLSAIKSAIQSVVSPDLGEIKGELKTINTKIDSLKNELRAEIKVVDTKVEQLDKRLDVVQRVAVLEARIKELERK